MRAARLTGYGSGLSLVDLPEPVVQRPHDVVVRIGGAGLCRTDLHILDGMLAGYLDVALPYTPGHENAGWVAEVGSAVTGVRAGDPVILHPELTCGVCPACRAGRDMYCRDSRSSGFNTDGGFAEYILVNERALVPLAEGAEPAAVAPLADAGLAAYRAVKRAAARLVPGSTVAVIGSGGLGHIAIQVLHSLAPARVLAIDISPTGLALAAQIGADEVIEGGGPGTIDAVHAATGGAGVDAVLDFVGDQDTPAQAFGMLAKGGTYHVIGYGGAVSIPTAELVGREITVAGSCVGSYTELVELMALSAAGRVHVHTETFRLEDITKAIDALGSGRVRGRAVITP
jgi:NAD+-dependent secondary alcohol dehydrogenase Adh1